jgi:hypothetical protein
LYHRQQEASQAEENFLIARCEPKYLEKVNHPNHVSASTYLSMIYLLHHFLNARVDIAKMSGICRMQLLCSGVGIPN